MNQRVYTTTWQQDSTGLMALRREVFIVEQKIPEELEWDKFDRAAVHFACEDISRPAIIGTARLIFDVAAHKAIIGRLCVAKQFRHQKVATRLMQNMVAHCERQEIPLIELHAQLYLKTFYENFGFMAQGDVYLEAGIDHITMLRG